MRSAHPGNTNDKTANSTIEVVGAGVQSASVVGGGSISVHQTSGNLVIYREKRETQYFREQLKPRVFLSMVLIPSGAFLMGAPDDEPNRDNDESPQHAVTVPRFFMSAYPITQVQWKAVANLPQVNQPLDPSPSDFTGNQRPVENVSWFDAVEFCDRLNRYTGRPYRLPSEAEWEYACRAGTTTPFHFGETIITELVNYDGDGSFTYGSGPAGEVRRETTVVGQFKVANAFGLYDMHGNVWEWCLDHWHDNYEGAPTDGSAWIGQTAEADATRVLRGGSWGDDLGICRSATRYVSYPADRNGNIGFRVVCSAPRTQ